MIDPLLLYRVYRRLWLRRVPFAPFLLSRLNRFITACDLPPSVHLGTGVRFRHWGIGVIVAAATQIGDRTIIFPKCRLLRAHPTARIIVGNDVQLGGSTTVIATGELRIGDGAQLAAGTVFRSSVRERKTVIGECVTTLPDDLRLPCRSVNSVLMLYRLARWFYLRKIRYLPGLFFRLNARINRSFIAPDVAVGHRFRIGYGAGLLTRTVIGDDVSIGAHASVMRNVRSGKGEHRGRVVVGNHVTIGRDAVLIASDMVEIGDGARIQEGTVTTKSVPAGCTAGGVPARIVSQAHARATR